MGDVTRALSGLEDFDVTGAVECAAGGLEVSVRDGLSYERPTVLLWTKRRFRCATPREWVRTSPSRLSSRRKTSGPRHRNGLSPPLVTCEPPSPRSMIS